MDVEAWLRSLGLGQYEGAFRDNAVDADIVPRLTADDLKDLGIASVGHRRKLLDAISELRLAALASTTSAEPVSPAAPPPTPSPESVAEITAERRPITVMFCDLVDSTALAAKLDAEDWRSLVNAYLDEAAYAVTGLGGHVLKKLGDGLMALFGYPHAQENDAERAVRAALAIQRALEGLNARNAERGAPALSARIGLDSGPVVVNSSGEVFGEAPNIAARVQGHAEPGSVLVTTTVQRQTAGLFVAEDRGPHELKGARSTVTLYCIVRASGGGRRGGARTATPLVGREEELDLLQRRWQRARSGEGQLALVVGEPGIGKSRLIEEFRARIGETPYTWVEWSSSQLLQNTPLHPFAEWGRQRFGVQLPAEQRLADLEGTLKLVGLDPGENAPLLAPIVDIPMPAARTPSLPPEDLRRRQLAAIVAWVLAGARSQPVALAIEDLHWADPTSLDLLQILADRGRQAPLFLIATARPEFRPPWSLRSHHSVVSLRPLARAEVEEMVGELAQRRALSKDVIENVSERTGGVPLFVEEVTRLLLERGEDGGAHAIPPTLQQSLAARLDRLGQAREIAQIGAVLGRGFSHALLRAVAEIDDAALRSGLERLADADILFVEGASPQTTYLFKHALIQDAAYESLLKSRRQPLHRRAAEVLRDSGAEPERIAHHFTEAGLEDLAIEWWGKAGDQALRRSAFQEAISHLGKAIAMADKAGEGQQLQLHVAYGNALIAARGYGAPETTEAFARARDSAASDIDAPGRLAADYGLWVGSLLRGELSAMRQYSTAFLSDVAARPDSPEAGVAHRAAGITHWYAGEHLEAREHLERALALFQPGRDDDLAFRFGNDAGVGAMLYLALTLWPLGDIGRAISLVGDAEARIAGLTHIGTRAYGNMHAAWFELMRGELSRAALNAVELARLTREHDLPMWRAYGIFLEGMAKAHQSGAPDAGLEAMRRGVELLREQNILLFDGLSKIALAEAEAWAGDVDPAVAILDEALATSERAGHRAFEAELHRVRGEMLLKRDLANLAPPEEAFQAAIAVAQQQSTRSFKLRAALSLAKLYQSTGRPVEAHAVLLPALEGFSPTPEMPEIPEAQALLAALAETDEVKSDAAQRQRRLQLQVAYGNALTAVRGYGAPATTEAFAKALAATGNDRAPERLAADFGLWVGAYLRGELSLMRTLAATFLADASAAADSPEAGVAERVMGVMHTFAGSFLAARPHLERSLVLFKPGRDDDLAFRFGHDSGVGNFANAALCFWILGEVDRAVDLMNQAEARYAVLAHAATRALGHNIAAVFNLMRGDYARAAAHGAELADLARHHDLPLWRAFAAFFDWGAEPRDAARVRESMRRGLELLRAQNVCLYDGLLKAALAEEEAKAGNFNSALEIVNEALATSALTGQQTFDAELHRVRADVLPKRGPGDRAAAEDAYRIALAIAKEQGARSFGLRAALALAKLYKSTGRPAEAQSVLALALDGFAPTPAMPEIAEAQALPTALADNERVKADAARRQRLTQLNIAYGNALFAARGPGAPETTDAFAKAHESAFGEKDTPERLAADYGLWIGSYLRGDLLSMRAHAEVFLSDVEGKPGSPEAGVAHRAAGLNRWFAGEYIEAREHLERALALFQPGRDNDLAFRFGLDPGVAAMAHLAFVSWPLGEVDRAVSLIERMSARMADLAHVGTLAFGRMHAATFELMCGDHARAATNAFELAHLAQHHDLNLWRAFGVFLQGWTASRSGAPADGLADMRSGVKLLREQNVLWFDGLLKIALAEAEAQAGDPNRAVAILDEALATFDRTGHRAFEAELHRVRGEILLQLDPASLVPAEGAFRTAIAVARQQATRSFGLRGALALAKFWQSTGRPADAHAVLSPALEGFALTPEFPEIGEARALLSQLA